MGLRDRALALFGARANEPYTFAQWLNDRFSYAGLSYPLTVQTTMSNARQELADGTFGSFAQMHFKGNDAVFSVEMARLALFSEATFQFRRRRSGRPGELFGSDALTRLETPWPGGTTGDLLIKMLLDHDLAGNAFPVRRPDGVDVLRPDWVTVILGSTTDDTIDGWDSRAREIGILYHPGGRYSGRDPEVYLPGQYGHMMMTPDPTARWRGMSWMTPLVRKVAADSAMTTMQLSYFENGATPNMVVKLDPSIALQAFNDWVSKFRQGEPQGLEKAYKTLYLGGGADVTVVGEGLQAIDFKNVQGAGESRIAAAGGVPATIVGFSEGLAGSALNAGNYGMARRRFADATLRPLWRNAAGSLASIVDVPRGAELWYDDRDIAFLREDVKDLAEVAQLEASTMRNLIDSGWKPETVKDAVIAGDWTLLKHSGLFSVQLQPPGPKEPGASPAGGSEERPPVAD